MSDTAVRDVVEFGRELRVSLKWGGTVEVAITAERAIARDGTFLLDSEDVDRLCTLLQQAKAQITSEPTKFVRIWRS